MLVKNTPQNISVQRTVASLDISGMYADEEFIKELLKVANGEKTSEKLRQEVLQKYTKK